MIVEKNGRTYEFTFDVRKAIELEENGFNIFKGLTSMTDDGAVSLVNVSKVCSALLGYSLPELADMGFTLRDLTGKNGLILKVIDESDFFSGMSSGPTSEESMAEGISATE
ncbi:MAG: hypothetical protein IJT54_03915 [Candidatus Methanomethylophilaceae archaeon]|nr:hypothetical protein [Candidatus Methanomethylophilaceae archaeon]